MLIHPGSRWLFKCWPARRPPRCSTVLAAMGWPLVMTGAPDPAEAPLVNAIKAALASPIVDLARPTDDDRAVGIDRAARLFIGCDTAPMHLASAAGTPIVAWFGPSDERIWGPWRVPHRVVTSTVHACRPCHNNGCGGSNNSDCLLTLPLDSVAAGGRLAARRNRSDRAAMRLGIVRQRYTPFGGAERFVERAIDTLIGRGVKVRMYTRSWPAARAGRIEPVICNPYYVGGVWRDAGFARAVRHALALDRPDIVQTHERIAGCDIFRAGDGVHRAWLAERLRAGGVAERLAIAANPLHRYKLAAERQCVRGPDAQSGDLHFADGPRRYPPSLCVARRKAARDLQRRRSARVQSRRARGPRGHALAARRSQTRTWSSLLVGSGYARKGVPIALRALARLPARARLVVVGRDKHPARYEGTRPPSGCARSRRVRRRAAGSASVSLARPMRSCCPRSTTRCRTRCWRRLPAACRSSPAVAAARASSSSPMAPAGYATRATTPRWRRTWSGCWTTTERGASRRARRRRRRGADAGCDGAAAARALRLAGGRL